jgi:hypothetical protein
MKSIKERIDSVRDGIWFVSLLSVPFTALMTFVIVGIWSVYGDGIISELREELGINENQERISEALGENRVLRQPYGLSYVSEPVYVNDRMVVNLTYSRTEYGTSCVFEGGRTSFIMPDGIPLGGSEIPVVRQIGENLTTFRLAVDSPSGPFAEEHLDDRWSVFLILQYDCQNTTEFEETYPMPFVLRSRPVTFEEEVTIGTPFEQ